MYYLPDEIWNEIWKYVYPISDLNNRQINDTINNKINKSMYCLKCGENSNCIKCEFCNNIISFECNNCKLFFSDNMICCIDYYNKYGMIN